MPNKNKDTHIFIAYASKDQAAHDTLLSHLNVLQKEIPITIWSEADLMPGAEIQKATQAELQRADIVLLLVSNDSLNSEAYQNIQSQVQQSTICVPVLWRACLWESDPFLQGLQPLPKNRTYISQADDEDKVYTEIAQAIKKMVVGEVEDTPFVPPVNESPFWKKSVLITLVAVLTLVGIWGISNLFNGKVGTPTDDITPDEPLVSTTLNPEYGTPIFTTDTTLFKILIIRFEDNLNKDGETHCIGRSIEENFIQLKEKGLPIYAIYADTIASPKYSEEAERIQNHHNADVLIYGLANEIQENCTAANVCFRHVVANMIMANLSTSKDKRIKHDTEYEKMSHSDIEQGKLSVDEQSMENWVTGLIFLKKNDEDTYFEEIEKMIVDTIGMSNKDKSNILVEIGGVYLDLEHYEKAILSYSEAIELNPSHANTYYDRGYIYYLQEKTYMAKSDYDKAKILDPESNFYIYQRYTVSRNLLAKD